MNLGNKYGRNDNVGIFRTALPPQLFLYLKIMATEIYFFEAGVSRSQLFDQSQISRSKLVVSRDEKIRGRPAPRAAQVLRLR